jgi:sensor histidine kinase YesM
MLLFGFRDLEELKELAFGRLGGVLVNAALTVVLFYFAVSWLNKKVIWADKWLLRLVVDMALILVYSAIFISFANFIASSSFFEEMVPPQRKHKEFLYVVPLMMNTLFLVLIEMILAIEERNQLALQVAHLEKEQINAKYGALKEQLDHHFLFNNLSVLSSLIYEDVEKADHFIQDFSSTYRYVLQINQRNLVTLDEELEFIDTYLHLYKFRFEEGFCYSLKVGHAYSKWMLPPLSLQVLVENAIKHNEVSRQHPLCLKIENDGGWLIVTNTIRPKNDRPSSTQKGQLNLLEKYRLLGSKLPQFKEHAGEYMVRIPLIKPHED